MYDTLYIRLSIPNDTHSLALPLLHLQSLNAAGVANTKFPSMSPSAAPTGPTAAPTVAPVMTYIATQVTNSLQPPLCCNVSMTTLSGTDDL
jgi:hypothetical protein